jgi:OmpA-OmpF porin, OOP family
MRISSALVGLAAFVLAGVISVFAAGAAVSVVEHRSVVAVQESLIDQGHNWASVLGDGLQVIIEGQAPTEVVRFQVMSIAGGIVDASRVIDNMSVKDTAGVAAPTFSVEILRNDAGVSLIGLIPASADRAAINTDIAALANGLPVTDLLDVADYPMPDGWRPSMTFALRALAQLPRSKISVIAGHVTVLAISDSEAQRRRLETDLSRAAPDGVQVELSITAPRPVITPFTVRFNIDERGPHFDACAADTPESQALILSAAVAAGVEGQIACPLGLGVPSTSWGSAVARSIAALKELGQGTVTFSDADISLVAAVGTDRAAFDRIVGDLSNALPDVFALQAVLTEPQDAVEQGPPDFSATLSPEGAVQVRGRVPDGLINTTVENYALAQFGRDHVTMGTRITEGLPQDWTVRILAGLESLSLLESGSILVQPALVTVSGKTGSTATSADISRLLIEKLGQTAEFKIDVVYVEALDPVAGLPTPQECVDQIAVVTDQRKITFDPGSATLSAEAQPVVDDIAEILKRCPDVSVRVAGYTDSQGRDQMNLDLSQSRADAVLEALASRRIPVAAFTAIGFGEAGPIADNGTEAGREANRRIEFTLIVPEGTPETLPDAATGPDSAASPAAGTGYIPPTTPITPLTPRFRPTDGAAVPGAAE